MAMVSWFRGIEHKDPQNHLFHSTCWMGQVFNVLPSRSKVEEPLRARVRLGQNSLGNNGNHVRREIDH
jgi:hypothetical protein